MCGLAGGWSKSHFALLSEAIPRMGAALLHRGPDDTGQWQDGEAGITFIHRRLAIVDLSPAGHQPMQSASGRWVIAYNGEIYNHLDLRKDLQKSNQQPKWRGHSDTETLLAAIEAWGVEKAVRRSVGMFAFALWDREDRCLWLARDRFGEKPLYYGWLRGVFAFSSELKALRVLPCFDGKIDQQSLALFLQHNSVPAPFSIYEGIHKLLPGHMLRLGSWQLKAGDLPAPDPYWRVADAASRGHSKRFIGSPSEASDEVERRMRKAVARQMLSDVPLGAFLSGGVDSSTVVALMQAQSAQPVKTFSIGFTEEKYNEATYAAKVARHLATDHTEMYVTPKDAMSIIPDLSQIYDEPFSDASQIPTLLVARLARKHVKVALSGDGGDEVFAGYSRYFLASRIWNSISAFPRPLRRLTGRAIHTFSVSQIDRVYRVLQHFVPPSRRWSAPGDKLHKGAHLLTARDWRDLYRTMNSHWSPASVLQAPSEHGPFEPVNDNASLELIEKMMLEDTCHYLPDDILVKVDRAAMSCGLETRVPILDHELVEFVWTLPLHYKVQRSVGKHVLRNVLYRFVPPALVERPKMGFGVPLADWLRGPLKEWAGDLLASQRLRSQGLLKYEPINRKWLEHQSGSRNWEYHLWDILMLQAWLDRNK